MVTASINARWTSLNFNQKKLKRFTTPLSADPTSIDDIITYSECETNTVHI
jgi:hypothetical protein